MMRRALWALSVSMLIVSCARQAQPAALDTINTACHYCRMSVSDLHFAAQIAAPGAEPVFFDDLGCLRNYLKATDTKLAAGAVVFVADHRTGAWVRAGQAIFTRTASLSTPMNGGMVAHADAGSRDQDAAAAGGTPVSAAEILGPAAQSTGAR